MVVNMTEIVYTLNSYAVALDIQETVRRNNPVEVQQLDPEAIAWARRWSFDRTTNTIICAPKEDN